MGSCRVFSHHTHYGRKQWKYDVTGIIQVTAHTLGIRMWLTALLGLLLLGYFAGRCHVRFEIRRHVGVDQHLRHGTSEKFWNTLILRSSDFLVNWSHLLLLLMKTLLITLGLTFLLTSCFGSST
jgi:hypothetical protein